MDYMTNAKLYDFIKEQDPSADIEYEDIESMSLPEIINEVWRCYVDDDRRDGAFIKSIIEQIINH